jgi:hypothetical protein
MRVLLLLFAGILSCVGGPIRAQNLVFPAPHTFTTSEDAEKAFKKRAALVITMSACGRELDYVKYRAQVAGFDNEGDFAELLTAKIGWLNDPQLGQQACEAPAPFTISDPGPDISLWNTRPTNCQDLLTAAHNNGTVSILVKVTPDCMRRQVNEAIRAMQKRGQMGTTFCPGKDGDFDMVVMRLTRLLYMGQIGSKVLEPSTIEYMYKHLLVAKGGPSDADISLVDFCADPNGDDESSPVEWANRAASSQSNAEPLLSALGDLLVWFLGVELELDAMVALDQNLLSLPVLLLMEGENPGQLPVFDFRLPETENHQLMIESSRYLTNKAMIRELVAPDKSMLAAVHGEQAKVREFLLRDLQRIAVGDFDEYNSRPYTEQSLESILNLYDFSNLPEFSDDQENDQEMCTASAIVLDLSAAKFVASSNRGRRIVPYRRRAQYDGTNPNQPHSADLYNITEGADHEVVRAFLLAGQTQLFLPADPGRPADGIPALQTGGAVNTAVSDYRLPDDLLEIVADRDSTSTAYPFSQSVRHGGIESYYQSRAFTMSLGGIQTPVAIEPSGPIGLLKLPDLIFSRDDRGIAMPTSIIPTIAGRHKTDEVFSFLGDGTGDKRSENLCGWQGFICGINPHIPDLFDDKCKTLEHGVDDSGAIVDYVFVDSAKCLFSSTPGDNIPGPHFYLAAKKATCSDTFCDKRNSYGLMEIVENPVKIVDSKDAKTRSDNEFISFIDLRLLALSASVLDEDGNGIYHTASGDTINYQIKQDRPHISSVNGKSQPQFSTSPNFLTQGGIINSEGTGKIHIINPSKGGGEILTIDFTDPLNPQLKPKPKRCQEQPPINTGPIVQPPVDPDFPVVR